MKGAASDKTRTVSLEVEIEHNQAISMGSRACYRREEFCNKSDLQGALYNGDGPLCAVPLLACELHSLAIDVLSCASNCLPCLLEGSTCSGT